MSRRDVSDFKFVFSNKISDKVDIRLNVFGPGMVYRIRIKCLSSNVVAPNNYG